MSRDPLVALAVGHVTIDEAVLPDGSERRQPGGSVAFVAECWRALGARAMVVTSANTLDQWPQDVPVDVQPGPTTRFRNVYRADGSRTQRLTQAGPPVAAPGPWPQADVLLLCPVLGEVDAVTWLKAVAAPHKAVGLQGWLKRSVADEVVHGPIGVDPGQFTGANLACLSEEDLAGDQAWLAALCRVVPRVALTRGHAGAVLLESDRRTVVPAHPARVVDPTGAGDTFAAALVLGLAEGLGFVAAAERAAGIAARAIEFHGLAPREALVMS